MLENTSNGWLFDAYHLKDKMILRVKDRRSGNVERIEYYWSPSIYVAFNSEKDADFLLNNRIISSFIKNYELVHKFEYPSTRESKKPILKLTLKNSFQMMDLANAINMIFTNFGQYRLYNVDISPEQSFFYEKELCPLGLYTIVNSTPLEKEYPQFEFAIDKNENIDSFDYTIPNLKLLSFDFVSDKKSITNNLDNEITKIIVVVTDEDNNIKERYAISEDTEFETILVFCYDLNRLDPDIIITTGGDQFLFPHLFHRAKANGIETQLLVSLNREKDTDFLRRKNNYLVKSSPQDSDDSTFSSSSFSYISYGKMYFKPRPFFLYGRIHLDTNTSFIFKDNGTDGLAEISRICRMPLQLASRSTIGKCLSSLYFYNAQKRDVLIPWKPITSEIFKTFSDLLKADKGGTVFESKPGAYNKVAEYDFVSLYPNIMFLKNVSLETINCECCKNEPDNKVPELEHLYHVCKKKTGIVPLTLKTVLDRRLEYKKRRNSLTTKSDNDIKLRNCYDNRQTALKWILVTSFGYLGFSNSKFGRIDAHIAVCAFARDILQRTSRIAEKNGFEVIHGIVDSIWIKRCDVNEIRDSEKNIIYENLKKGNRAANRILYFI